MTSTMIALPQNFQHQSPLVSLPAEIKHIIFGFCFVADAPIVDPVIGSPRPGAGGREGPVLGLNLLQTCRRLYHEADRRLIYIRNTFRFTTVDRVRCFFSALGKEHSAAVREFEIDARRVHSNQPGVAREWLHYLAWGSGTWAKLLGSLREDAPGLKCLRLNFESWPSIPMFRAELWNLLRSMILQVEGLERIVVIGASKGPSMARRDPWSPVHFVGGDDVGADDLVERMWKCVDAESDQKMVRWIRKDGRLELEVVSRAYFTGHVDRRWTGFCKRNTSADPWPETGSCSLSTYQERSIHVSQPVARHFSPSAAG